MLIVPFPTEDKSQMLAGVSGFLSSVKGILDPRSPFAQEGVKPLRPQLALLFRQLRLKVHQSQFVLFEFPASSGCITVKTFCSCG